MREKSFLDLQSAKICRKIRPITVKGVYNMDATAERIHQIRSEMAAIQEFAEGTVSCSSSRYRLKDGTWKKAKPHWKFQSLGPRGKRRYLHVPAACVERVRELAENGKRYRALETEYARLVTEASLAGAGEKTSCCPGPGSGGWKKSSRRCGSASPKEQAEFRNASTKS